MLTKVSADHMDIGDGAWAEGTLKTGSVADGTLLVDTGPLPAGSYWVAVQGSSDVAIVFDLQHRNAANDANVKYARRRPAAGDIDFMPGAKVQIGVNERFRAVLVGGVTGNIKVEIFTHEVA